MLQGKLTQIPEAPGQGPCRLRAGHPTSTLKALPPHCFWTLAKSQQASPHPLVLPNDKHGCQIGAS